MLANGDWQAEPYSDPGLANNRSCYVLIGLLCRTVVRLQGCQVSQLLCFVCVAFSCCSTDTVISWMWCTYLEFARFDASSFVCVAFCCFLEWNYFHPDLPYSCLQACCFSSWTWFPLALLQRDTTRKPPASDLSSGPPAEVRAGKCAARWSESENTQAEPSEWEATNGIVSHDVFLVAWRHCCRHWTFSMNIVAIFSTSLQPWF